VARAKFRADKSLPVSRARVASVRFMSLDAD
jgi:hypothetical protein